VESKRGRIRSMKELGNSSRTGCILGGFKKWSAFVN
jgi:hypothetical protein